MGGINIKICEYCGTEVADEAGKCGGCGSSTFKNTSVDSGADLPDKESNIADVQIFTYAAPELKKKSQVSPVFAVLFIISILIVIIGLNTGVKKNDTAENVKTAVKTEAKKEVKKEVKKELSDTELLTLPGHPEYYGDFKEAAEFWKGYEKVKVATSAYDKVALLLITPYYADNNVISRICFDFGQMESGHELTVNDVLKIVCDYIPYDILEKYYTFDRAFHETSVRGGYEGYHYVMRLNDEGRAARKSDSNYLADTFAFQIICSNENEWEAEINSSADYGNYQSAAPRAYKVKDWEVDINVYR